MDSQNTQSTEVVAGVAISGAILEGEVVSAIEGKNSISAEAITLYEKVKAAFAKYDFELVAFYEIGYEARIATAGRTTPLSKEELQNIISEIGIDYIMTDFADANYAWRVFYTAVMDPSASTVRID